MSRPTPTARKPTYGPSGLEPQLLEAGRAARRAGVPCGGRLAEPRGAGVIVAAALMFFLGLGVGIVATCVFYDSVVGGLGGLREFGDLYRDDR